VVLATDRLAYVTETYGTMTLSYGSRREGDPDRLVADASLASRTLKWKPQYSTLPIIVDTAWKWYVKSPINLQRSKYNV
jgi:UDP-glucose 4-epimerase